MKKLFNLRITLLFAVFLGLGAAFSYLTVYYSSNFHWLILVAPLTCAAVVISIIKRNKAAILLSALCAAFFLFGTGGVYLKLSAYNNARFKEDVEYTICGTVYEKGFYSDGEYIKLKDATIDGKPADGRICVYLDEQYGEYCEVGYEVEFSSELFISNAFAYGAENSSRIIENIKYICYPSEDLQSEYAFSFFGAANSAVRELVFENTDEHVAQVAYAMLTGNTEFIESGTQDSFRYGGIAHIFAVSGLHIGLLYAFVSCILKRIRLNAYIAAAVSIAIIFLYSGICGFTLSSLRAAIMCTVSCILRLTRGKYDALSSVSISFIILILINPLNIISVGFRLSVSAVAGIAVFSRSIERLLKKIKLPQKLASGVSVSLSAQIFTFPILLSSFGYVSAASLLLNIIFVPVFSVIFLLLFTCMAISLLIPPIAPFLFLVPSVPLGACMSLIMYSGAEKVLISGINFGAFCSLYYLAAIFLSDKINLRFSIRSAVALILAAVVGIGMTLVNSVPRGSVRVVVSGYYGECYCVLLTTSQGSVLIISESVSKYDLSSLISENFAGDLNAVIILGGDDSVFAYMQSGVDCKDIYVYDENINIQPFYGKTVHYESAFELCGVYFEYIDGYNLTAEYGGATVGINFGMQVSIEKCDLLICPTDAVDCKFKAVAYLERVAQELNCYDSGDLQFIAKDGNIYTKGINGGR